jgi:hypothetical protein
MNWEAIGAVGSILGAITVVVSVVYLARQISMSNRLARADAFRTPNSQLNSINAAFGTNANFRPAIRLVLLGANRREMAEDDRVLIDFYFFSITNIYDQLAREVYEGILEPNARDFGGKGIFVLPYYKASWSLYRDQLSSAIAEDFEKRFDLDPTIEAQW